MTNEQTVEGNVLIAEFLGLRPHKVSYTDATKEPIIKKIIKGFKIKRTDIMVTTELDLKYHSSWDWLMPVVEKINNENINIGKRSDFTPAGTSIEMSFYIPYEVSMWNETGWSIVIKEDTPIQSLWIAIIEFIKWYNQQKTNTNETSKP